MTAPRTYEMEIAAADATWLEWDPLGPRWNARAAQKFVDHVVTSDWWRNVCPPSWLGDHTQPGNPKSRTDQPPTKVIVRTTPLMTNWTSRTMEQDRDGLWAPPIYLSTYRDHPKSPPDIANPWVVLHELAHVMTFPTAPTVPDRYPWHGPLFRDALVLLVDQFIGRVAGEALATEYMQAGLRVTWPERAGNVIRPQWVESGMHSRGAVAA